MASGLMLLAVAALTACVGCDKGASLTEREAEAPPPMATASSSPSALLNADAALADFSRITPVRPVPTSSPTVLVTMPMEVQLQAIQYMATMQAPQPGDASPDPTYAKTLADSLRAVGKPDVVSSGRRIDLQMEKGCDATLPRQSIARYTGASLGLLLAHGILVVRCADHAVQCLQSTRDANDVLCTHK